MRAPDTAPRMKAFLEMYSSRASEATRLYQEMGHPVLLCVEQVPETIEPDMTLVGKTLDQIKPELDLDAYTVRCLLHQIRTHDPTREAIFVLQFDASHIDSAVVRIDDGASDEDT